MSELKLCTERLFIKGISNLYRNLGLDTCVVCGAAAYAICRQCLNNYEFFAPQCGSCNKFAHLGSTHQICKNNNGHYDLSICLYSYTKVQRTILNEIKYNDLAFQLFHSIELMVRQYFSKDPFLQIDYIKKNYNKIILLPTPTTLQRIKARGFFPAKEISIIFGRNFNNLGIKVKFLDGLLLKTKEIETQSHNDRMKRLVAINSAYDVNIEILKANYSNFSTPNTLILIVDDVHTTGATATILIENFTKAINRCNLIREDLSIGFLCYAIA